MPSTLARSRRPLALAIALALGAGGADAATIAVTSGGDAGDSGTCTLRQAIVAIESQTLTGTTCSFSNGDPFGTNDTIVFDDTLTAATITLAQGQLSVGGLAAPLTIRGSGQTIEASFLARVLYAKSVTLTVSSLTLMGGSAFGGGGMYASYSTVTLSNSTVSGNYAHNGGGVRANISTLTLTDSVVSGNTAFYQGGGVYARHSTVTLTDSTVSDNSAVCSSLSSPGCGPGPFSYAKGGGVYDFFYSTVTLTNSTVSSNHSAGKGGGVYNTNFSTVTLTNSTVSGNSASKVGGGVYAAGHSALTLNNTILSSNTAGSLPDLFSDFSVPVSATYNLLGTALNKSPFNTVSFHNIFSDLPGLGALADNGGPTQTMAPTVGSPALSNGDPLLAKTGNGVPLNYDQRGPRFPRTLPDGTMDIGAFQHQGTDRIFTNGFESGP